MAKKFGKNIDGSVSFNDMIDEVENAKLRKFLPSEKPMEYIKTYQFLNEDIEFLEEYARGKAFFSGSDFSVKLALREAIALMREKYPEVTERIKKRASKENF